MCTPPPSAGVGGGGEPLPDFRKGGDLTGHQFLEGGCWERGSDFGILNDKKGGLDSLQI